MKKRFLALAFLLCSLFLIRMGFAPLSVGNVIGGTGSGFNAFTVFGLAFLIASMIFVYF